MAAIPNGTMKYTGRKRTHVGTGAGSKGHTIIAVAAVPSHSDTLPCDRFCAFASSLRPVI
ncbi:hypothetical protein GCM10018785_02380 [Streptomyces longispororuber]|uniref:Uncharacterized protein n=1 Tax=Streptomyces longispororuber TaxID=68230 RepID=A0A918Z4V3_9ACTN|nr:hypothetical protein GCM10018785_02380 [Streptomyces longispororuber]